MKREVRIDIAGQSLTIRSDGDEEYLKSLARYVDGRIKELSLGQGGTTTLSLAILAALNIADEYHKLLNAQETVNQRLNNLVGELEATMAQTAA